MLAAHDRTQSLSLVQSGRSLQVERAYLLLIRSGSSEVYHLPTAGELTVGRAEDTDIRVEDHSASRQHARFRISGGGLRVADLDSRNGTWVNGEPIREERVLSSGDVVLVGSLTLVVQLGSEKPAGTPPPGAAQPAASAAALHRLQLGEREVLLADPAMVRLYELLRRLAGSALPVLVTGETGTGKENAAFAVHHFSPRARGPFVSLNCAAIPETLVESELFGHERGAFSGAVQAKLGRITISSGGTLFLDELGELSGAVQAKLLRVLETGRVLPVGATREHEVDLRIVAATNRDLEAEMAGGRFRQDLFFRLCTATVVLPPLRERPSEIAPLALEFLKSACTRIPRAQMHLADATRQLLQSYAWPGNVRELRNLMDYVAVAVAGGELLPEHLPPRLRSPERPLAAPGPGSAVPPAASPPPAPEPLDPLPNLGEEVLALERQRMAQALARTHGNQRRAAELIGMPLRTFVSKLKQHKLREPE